MQHFQSTRAALEPWCRKSMVHFPAHSAAYEFTVTLFSYYICLHAVVLRAQKDLPDRTQRKLPKAIVSRQIKICFGTLSGAETITVAIDQWKNISKDHSIYIKAKSRILGVYFVHMCALLLFSLVYFITLSQCLLTIIVAVHPFPSTHLPIFHRYIETRLQYSILTSKIMV